MNKGLHAIEYYNRFAQEYDKLSKEHHWISPQILFGMLFDYLKPSTKLLDVGIGTGKSSEPFNKMGISIFGVDGSEQMLLRCRKKNICEEIKCLDLEKASLPYADSFFDYVISNGVFYFIENLERLIAECIRVLRPGGIFALNYEELELGDESVYKNISNCTISNLMKEKTGVTVYRNKREYIEAPLAKMKMLVLERFKYYAYTSPTSNQDVYFTMVICKKEMS